MAMILDAFVGRFAQKLVELIEDRAVMILGVKDDLQQLQRRLAIIESVLADAERRRIREKAIDAWVRQLKDVVYDADDMIDLCRIKEAQLQNDGPKVSYCLPPLLSCLTTLPLRNEIGSKIKNINGRLDVISKDMSGFNLSHSGRDVHDANTISRVNRRQTSELVDSNVVGEDIENATNALVELLVNKQDQRKCVLYAVSGMGGIGKTTLAQQIFNDRRIDAKFSSKAWVCVLNVFDETSLLQQIIRKVGGSQDGGGYTAKSELLPILKDAVFGKSLFLVLDDVWEGGEGVWTDLLRIPLQSGASGCRVVITTRDENVAKRMGAAHIHQVDQLSTSSGWELLCKLVFADGQERDIASLEDVGVRIVEKCRGLPLAIKAISGILTTRSASRRAWEHLLANSAWSMSELPEELRGALYLSYEDLPSPLKQCFLYLSLFPEDFVYYRNDMVRLWVAEGFVEPQGDSLLEDVGEGYFEELARRNILQKTFEAPDGILCKMHDLMRSLAQYLSRDESCFYESAENLNAASATKFQVRRLACAGKTTTVPEPIFHQKSLRTLISFGTLTRFENDALVKLKYLRILHLAESKIESLPESIGNLVHLRLLDLYGTRISEVPQNIVRLTNLQTLNLSYCESLRSLPIDITQLCNLRHLLLFGTPLSYLPKGIGRLKQLNQLSGFIIGEDITGGGNIQQGNGCGLEELGSLFQLRGLSIEKLERAKVMISAAILTNNHHLKNLALNCSPYSNDNANSLTYSEQEVDELQKLFEQLSPPSCLDKLWISSYFGRRFPDWMMKTSSATIHLLYLTELFLDNCTMCSQLPPLGQLPQLKRLGIRGASSVVSIGPKLLGFRSQEGNNVPQGVAFAKLDVLYIASMPNWEKWSLGEEFDQRLSSPGLQLLPCLRHFTLLDCPKLRELPNGLRHCSIQDFTIRRAHALKRVSHLPCLSRRLDVEECRSLEQISDLPTLGELCIQDCPALVCVERLDSLRKLQLQDGFMEHLPKWLSRPIKQRRAASPYDNLRLVMWCNIDVLRRCCEGCQDWPIIQQFSRVNAYQLNGTAGFSYTTEPSGGYKFNANF